MKKTYRPFFRLFLVFGYVLCLFCIFSVLVFSFTFKGIERILGVLVVLFPLSASVFMLLYSKNIMYVIDEDAVYYTNWLGKSFAYPYSSFTKVEFLPGRRGAGRYRFRCGDRIAFYISDTITTEPLMRDMMKKIPVLVKAEFYVQYSNYGVEKFDRLTS